MSYQFEQNTEKICDRLQISRKVRKRALEIAEQIVEEDTSIFQPYGGFDAVVVSSVHAAGREAREPVDSSRLKEAVDSISSMNTPEAFSPSKIRSSYRTVCNITDTEYKPVNLENYKDLIYKRLDVSDETLETYEKIASKLDQGLISRSPKSVSAAAIYLASALNNGSNDRLSQSEISEVFNVSRTTIRKAKNDIIDQLTKTDVETVSVNDRIFSAHLLGLEE